METGSRRVAYLSVLNLYQDNLQSVATKVNQMPFWKPVFCCFFFKSPVITLFCTGNHCASPRLNFSFCIWHSHLYCLSWLLLLSTQFFFSFFFFFQTNDCLLQNMKFIANPAPSSFIRTFTLERHTWLNVWTSKCTLEATVVCQINVALCTNCL